MTNLAAIKFFVTPVHQCSYLPRNDATTLFADPKASFDHNLYSELSEVGFRRSGNYLYRPHCKDCNACIPVRIPVEQFQLSKRQRRIWNKNSDLEVTQLPARNSDEHYQLYAQYINHKHLDGDMFPPTPEQYESFLLSEWGNTQFFEFRTRQGQLLAVAVTDLMSNGLSAVYTFYNTDPAAAKRSLGVFAVLWQIEQCRQMGLPALYLGYWIKNCQKMQYKSDYRPLEIYTGSEWITMPDDMANDTTDKKDL